MTPTPTQNNILRFLRDCESRGLVVKCRGIALELGFNSETTVRRHIRDLTKGGYVATKSAQGWGGVRISKAGLEFLTRTQ